MNPTNVPSNPVVDQPLDNFTDCHKGIIAHLDAFSELPALAGNLALAGPLAKDTQAFFQGAVIDHHHEEEKDLFPAVLAASSLGAEYDEVQRIVEQWNAQDTEVALKVIASPYREVTGPILNYVRGLRSDNPRDVVCVYIPEYIVGHWWEQLLHNQTGLILKTRLNFMQGVMVTSVPGTSPYYSFTYLNAPSGGAEPDWFYLSKDASNVWIYLMRAYISFGPTDARETAILHPSAVSLSQNYPNPFNPSTAIRFTLPGRQQVVLTIYDPLGREVETLVNESLEEGTHIFQWRPERAASGTYFYRLQAGQYSETKKLVYIR